MHPDEILWQHIQQLNESVLHVGSLGMAWFAYAATINATAAWTFLKGDIKVRTNVVAWAFVVSDLMAVLACFYLPVFYIARHNEISRLLSQLKSRTADLQPAFPVHVYCGVSIALGVVCLGMAVLWAYGIYKGAFMGKVQEQ